MSPGLDFRAILNLLGRPFVNGIARDYGPSLTSQTFGFAGLVMLAILLFRGRGVPHRGPALVLIGWSLLVAIQIATFRSDVAPWYVSPMAFFWAGLAVLLALGPVPFRGAGIAVIALLALIVQPTWEDKSFYLRSRSPASAACLREWRTAPPGCNERLFQWKGSAPSAWLGEPLDRHHLSVFGSRRTYLLQGDLAVGRVRLRVWIRGVILLGRRQDPARHRRLPTTRPRSVARRGRELERGPPSRSARHVFDARPRGPWRPAARARRARLGHGGGLVRLARERTFLPREETRPLSIDLSTLAGRNVTLRLEAEETHEGATPLVFEAPRVLLTLDPEQNHNAP